MIHQETTEGINMRKKKYPQFIYSDKYDATIKFCGLPEKVRTDPMLAEQAMVNMK